MPELISPDGRSYRTEDAATITRLTMSFGYRLAGEEDVPTVDDLRYHPSGKKVSDVLAYIDLHPEEKTRIIAEEKAGQNRPNIVNKAD